MKYNVIDVIKSDLYRYEKKTDIGSFLHAYAKFEGFRFSVWLRLCSYFRKNKFLKYTLLPFVRFIYKHYKYKFGYDIPYQIEIGPGLMIFHFGGIVFSPQKCGKNVTISQNTTVGMTVHEGEKAFPILGDNLYLAPGSAVIGGVIVGDNVAIGTNAVLNKSVESEAVVVGIPGRVISHNGSYGYVVNPFVE